MKTRKYAFGGDVYSQDPMTPNTYPFASPATNNINVGAQPNELGQTMAPLMRQYRKGGKVKSYAKGGVTRADGCVRKGHTKGKMV